MQRLVEVVLALYHMGDIMTNVTKVPQDYRLNVQNETDVLITLYTPPNIYVSFGFSFFKLKMGTETYLITSLTLICQLKLY